MLRGFYEEVCRVAGWNDGPLYPVHLVPIVHKLSFEKDLIAQKAVHSFRETFMRRCVPWQGGGRNRMALGTSAIVY